MFRLPAGGSTVDVLTLTFLATAASAAPPPLLPKMRACTLFIFRCEDDGGCTGGARAEDPSGSALRCSTPVREKSILAPLSFLLFSQSTFASDRESTDTVLAEVIELRHLNLILTDLQLLLLLLLSILSVLLALSIQSNPSSTLL